MAGGDWSTLYYAIFTDWKKKRRTFPLGETLDDARDALGELRNRNKGKYDFDNDKERASRALTLSEWGKVYFREKLDPQKRASGVDRERRSFKKLEQFLGSMTLPEISRR